MRRKLMTAFILVFSVSTAMAQDPEGDRPQRRDRGDRGPRMGRMFDRLAEDLALDTEQKRQFDELVAVQRKQMDAFREQRQAIRDAREAGDDARADELRSQLEQNGDPRESMRKFFESLDPILNDAQRDTLAEMRERFAQGRGQGRGRGGFGRRGGGGPGRMFRELPEQLKLDDAQRAQFDTFLQTQRDKMRSGFEKRRSLFREMRDAREAGDDARAEELQGQIDGLSRPDWGANQAETLNYVESILHEDQKPLLAAFREQMEMEGDAENDRDLPRDLRSVLRAASRVRLERAQRDELRKINKDARESLREARRTDKQNRSRNGEAEKALAAEVKGRIVKMMNEEQVAKYEEELKRMERRGGNDRARRRARGSRPDEEL